MTTIGTTGAGSASVQYPAFYNNVLGTKFKIVFGYPGGQHIDLAMERGEVEGRGTNPYSGWMASKPTWIPEKKIIPLIQAGVEKEPALPDVPLIIDQQVPRRGQAAACSSWRIHRRSDVRWRPRRAFPPTAWRRCARRSTATMRDPEFIAAAKKENMEIRPQTAEVLTKIIVGLLNSPQDVRDRMKVALQPKDEHTERKK